jgi:hypothetical protein
MEGEQDNNGIQHNQPQYETINSRGQCTEHFSHGD